jgi:hypothetical protein
MTTNQVPQQNSGAYHAQSVASFALSLFGVSAGIYFLDASGWQRAFLAIAVLYALTSAFTLAKVVRDKQEAERVVSRVDQARLEKLLAEHDLFKTDVL